MVSMLDFWGVVEGSLLNNRNVASQVLHGKPTLHPGGEDAGSSFRSGSRVNPQRRWQPKCYGKKTHENPG